jgi:putative Mg2+ transporter-C (MgtC) family protein
MSSLNFSQVFLRLAAAVCAGALIGLDRELRHKPAGLRTLALVSLGAAVFILETVDTAQGMSTDGTSRVIQGVVTGVGFLGAGAILRGTSGLAQWPLVASACILGLLVLVITPIERVLHNRRKSDLRDPDTA